MRVVELRLTDTYPLRRAVLRDNDPARSVAFAEDDDPHTFHLGVEDDVGNVVATSTWSPRPAPGADDRRAIQLRGMATAALVQRTGVGGLLIEAGAARCTAAGYEILWANARDTAVPFYERHGCQVSGDGFIDPVTKLAHHVVVRELV